MQNSISKTNAIYIVYGYLFIAQSDIIAQLEQHFLYIARALSYIT